MIGAEVDEIGAAAQEVNVANHGQRRRHAGAAGGDHAHHPDIDIGLHRAGAHQRGRVAAQGQRGVAFQEVGADVQDAVIVRNGAAGGHQIQVGADGERDIAREGDRAGQCRQDVVSGLERQVVGDRHVAIQGNGTGRHRGGEGIHLQVGVQGDGLGGDADRLVHAGNGSVDDDALIAGHRLDPSQAGPGASTVMMPPLSPAWACRIRLPVALVPKMSAATVMFRAVPLESVKSVSVPAPVSVLKSRLAPTTQVMLPASVVPVLPVLMATSWLTSSVRMSLMLTLAPPRRWR